MKTHFVKFYDAATTEQGGTAAIIAEIKGLSNQANENLKEVKTAFTTQVDDLKKQNAEQKAAYEKQLAEYKAEHDERLKEIKGLANEASVKVDALDKKAGTAGFGGAKEEKADFNTVLQKALEPYTDELEKIARKDNGRNQHLVIDLKAVGDITTANITGTAWSQINRGGIILNPDRARHMRELLPQGNLGAGSTYTFMKENGAGEGNPAPVAEGATKPQFDFDLAEATVNIETIAGWVRVTRKAMNNIPGFTAYLQQQMPKRLLKVEDQQILYGTGVTPEIKGLLTAGNFVASAATATNLIERILNDITLLEDTYEREANGIALRPADYNSFFKNKASGSGEYDLPQNVVFVNGQLYISGIPVIKTTALNAGDYIVGDFSMAQFLVQEGMRIEFFEQDGTNVRENKVTVRIEETVALPVFANDAFIKGSSVFA